MTVTAVRSEFAKMRRLRIVPLLSIMTIGIVLLASRELTSPGFFDQIADPSGGAWNRLLASYSFAVPLVSPIFVAVVASRQVDVEHQGKGWLLWHTTGVAMGKLCQTKLISVGMLLVVATVVQSIGVVGIGRLAGITAELPIARWMLYTGSVIVVNLVLLGLHILLSAVLENQLIGLGVSVIGVFIAASAPGMPVWLAHLTPWGYYSLATPTKYVESTLVAVDPATGSVAALLVIAVFGFTFAARKLDHLEA